MNLATSLFVLSTITLVVACGGEAEPTLDDYFADFETAVDAFIADSDKVAVEHGFLVNFDDVPGTVAGFEIFLPGIIEAAGGFAAELEDLRVPAAATASHEEVIGALNGFVTTASTMLSELPTISTSEALSRSYNRYAEAGSRFSESCRALQVVADTNGVEADLRCSS